MFLKSQRNAVVKGTDVYWHCRTCPMFKPVQKHFVPLVLSKQREYWYAVWVRPQLRFVELTQQTVYQHEIFEALLIGIDELSNLPLLLLL